MLDVKLYGTKRCLKSHLYQDVLKECGVPYILFGVERDAEAANEFLDNIKACVNYGILF